MSTLLDVSGLKAAYGPVRVLHGLDFTVERGEIVVILGANGAGKTTTLRALCGLVNVTGSVRLDGQELVGQNTEAIVRRGIAHVPQGRGTLTDLTVEDNLRVGAISRRDDEIDADIDRWYDTFPVLGERRTQHAGSLSGGEQQMLAIARAMMMRPELLLLDEPSLGLAPLIIEDLFAQLADINRSQGMAMLVVEQNAELALEIADRGYVLESGEIAMTGSAESLQDDDGVRRAYLGL